MLFAEPETYRFLEAVEKFKRKQRQKARQTRLAKQRVRNALKRLRSE